MVTPCRTPGSCTGSASSGEVAVHVGIDEAGADDLPRRVDGLLRARHGRAPDRGDAVAGDADVGRGTTAARCHPRRGRCE